MKKPEPLFDRKLLRVRRARGARTDGDRFLYARVADDMAERILDVNRTFQNSLLIADADMSSSIQDKVEKKLGQVTRIGFTDDPGGLDIIADEEALPFGDNTFDFIFSGLGLHAVNEIPRAVMDFKRLLKPDGLFVAAFFGGETLAGLRHALYEAEDGVMGRVSPRISPMISVQQAAGILQKSGFTMPVVDRDLVRVYYTSLTDLYTDLRRMGDTNILVDRQRNGASKRLFEEVASIYRRDHTAKNGRLPVNYDILWMTGWHPDESQPKPLKPGSAKSRLSDALGVKEYKL